jgi:hypothetical protein
MLVGRTNRRAFIAALGVAVWPLTARAQSSVQMRRIGVLLNLAADDPETGARLAAFLEALQGLGWSEGRNLKIDYRWGTGDLTRHRANIAELVTLAPDVGGVAADDECATAIAKSAHRCSTAWHAGPLLAPYQCSFGRIAGPRL